MGISTPYLAQNRGFLNLKALIDAFRYVSFSVQQYTLSFPTTKFSIYPTMLDFWEDNLQNGHFYPLFGTKQRILTLKSIIDASKYVGISEWQYTLSCPTTNFLLYPIRLDFWEEILQNGHFYTLFGPKQGILTLEALVDAPKYVGVSEQWCTLSFPTTKSSMYPIMLDFWGDILQNGNFYPLFGPKQRIFDS